VSDSPAVTEGEPEQFPSPQLRYRRFRGGYKREDVEEALRDLQVAMRALEIDLEALRARSEELDGELADMGAELEAYRTREAELDHALVAARTSLQRASRIEETAGERSREILGALASVRESLAVLERSVAPLAAESEPIPSEEAGGDAGGEAPPP
jgi:chromosome segregation ATPase